MYIRNTYLTLKLSTVEQVERLRDLVGLFCNTKIHTVQKYTNKAETMTTDDTWEEYTVELHYTAKITMATAPVSHAPCLSQSSNVTNSGYVT